MKVIQMQKAGGPEVLEPVERPLPEPSEGEIRVRAQAIGVSSADMERTCIRIRRCGTIDLNGESIDIPVRGPGAEGAGAEAFSELRTTLHPRQVQLEESR